MQRPNVYWWKDVISRLCLVSSLRRGQETSKKVRSSKRTLLYNDVCTYLKNLFILNLIIFYFFPFKYWVLVPLYGCGRWWCPVDVRVGILLHRAGIQDGCSRYRDNGVSRLPLSGMGINSLGHSILKSPPPHEKKKLKNMPFTLILSLHSYCAYVEKLFNNQIFLHPLSTTQQWKHVRHETLPLWLLLSLFWNCHYRPPTYQPQTSAPPPPHLLFPTAVARKQLSIWGNHEKTRERSTLNETLARALSSLVINGVLSCRLPLPGI